MGRARPPQHRFHSTGLRPLRQVLSTVGDWRGLIQVAKTAAGLLPRDLEFEIIGDYTHPSPFLQKKGEICLIPHSGAASEGVQGQLASSLA